ncbi:hypothetical protein, partial [Lacticaseibacillus sp. GG6-2]
GLFVVHRSPTSPLSQYSQRSKRCFQTGQMRFHVPNTEVNNPGNIEICVRALTNMFEGCDGMFSEFAEYEAEERKYY